MKIEAFVYTAPGASAVCSWFVFVDRCFAESVKGMNLRMSETKQKSFDAIVQKEGSFIFVAIPFAPREAWGAKPRYAVTGAINGISVRGTLGVLGQDYFLRLAKTWMRDCGIDVGDKVNVRLSLGD